MTETYKPTAELSVPTTLPLTQAAIDGFARDGFISIEKVIDDDLLEELRTLYDELLAGKFEGEQDDRQLGGLIRQVIQPSRAHPRFRDNPALDTARELVRTLGGVSDPEMAFDMLIYKQPGNTNPTPWHQDASYRAMPFAEAGTPINNSEVTVWIPLDDADPENGCMQFILGAHLQPLRPHYVFSADPADDGRLLATDEYDVSEAVVCPVRAGGCTVHTGGTLHFTGGNLTADRARRAYISTWGPRS